MLKHVLGIGILLAGFPASAVIDLMPKMIEIAGKEDAPQVTIINKSDHVEYVTVSLSRLVNPGVPYEQEKLEPIGLARNPQLYAYPFKLSLARGQSKTINLKSLAAVTQETVYRLDVKPAIEISGSGRANSAAGIAVNLSFSALVRQLPDKQTSSIRAACRANAITLTATGNTRYQAKNSKVDGQRMDDFNIYPGTPKVITGNRLEIDGKVLCKS
ncbi:hypothetical protein LJN55_22025 [Erwinia rhapontici]|uniref:hypothetical protein n=1 Tax=Erwinia rhapontici TaxID=55212 RepID=UPI001D0D933D|nr:hypothetical protein [Erwinia rhapontici]UDQ80052.1 hypothetical protein LJN55_22025 [Erwinia rhapontici]